ncbi:hypothetical protein GQ53DRAFT_797790 [Thozetella sp. PMI_491]|nr:hypothetical protein GQ53DRAFT_797790 [Thozetella sp. PMI_491]
MGPYENKKAFFAELEALSNVDDDDLGTEEVSQRNASHAFFAATRARPPPSPNFPSNPVLPPRRIIEATPQGKSAQQAPRRASPDSSFYVEGTPIRTPGRQGRTAPQKRATIHRLPAVAVSDTSRLAKDMEMVPENQIFSGLSFFYIPDNDVAPIRRMRIQSAIEHGATWVRQPSDATHVIVDKALKFDDIEGILRPVASQDRLVVVNEDFPLDCTIWKRMLNADQKKYRVKDYPLQPSSSGQARGVGHEPLQGPSSQSSLRLKELHRNEKKRKPNPTGSPKVSDQEPVASSRVAATTADSQLVGRPSSRSGHTQTQGTDSSEQDDELLQYIQLVRNYQGPPLDSEEEGEPDSRAETVNTELDLDDRSAEASDGETARKKRATASLTSRRKNITFEERFVCHKGGTLDTTNTPKTANARTIEILQSMCDYYERTNDQWRHLSYRKAITLLKNETTRVTTIEQAMALPGIGKRLAEKIIEIVNTDKLEKLENAKGDPHIHALELFMGIYDVGNSRANKWIAQGFRTLDDIREKADLTRNQRLGLEHYDDLNSRIPRVEMDALGGYVRNEAAKINPDVELLIGGSYRRGSSNSGDIDFIVTKKGTSSHSELVPFLNELVDNLTQTGFLTAALASLHSHRTGKEGPGSKWHGCCVLPRISGGFNDNESYHPTWRRIDFLLVPETEFGAALIYFTGNDIFNRSMRLLASKKGMRLNQRGLYKHVLRGQGREKVTDGQLLEGRDEKRIFEILGVKWRKPEERWC